MKNLLIHVGYPKTASTWFQNQVFSNADLGFCSIPRSFALNDLILPKATDFNVTDIKVKMQHILSNCEFEGNFPVLSHEIFVGNPQSGGYNTRELAYRLGEICGNAKILILIRRQDEAIFSTYKQYIRTGGKCNLKDYLFPPIDGRIPLFDFGYFEYHKVIDIYQNLFGHQNVKVVPFEYFISNKNHVIMELFDWLEIKAKKIEEEVLQKMENPSIRGIGVYIKRYLNSVLSRRDSLNPSVPFRISLHQELILEKSINALTGLFPSKLNESINHGLKEVIINSVGDRYRESNRLSKEATGIDLGTLGYDI